MPTLRWDSKRMRLEDAQYMPREFSRMGDVRSFGLDGDIVRRLKAYFQETLILTPRLVEELRAVAKTQRSLAEVATAADWEGDVRLYPFQRVAVEWLHRIRRGILADEQGLGKTVMALVAAEREGQRLNLIICNNTKRADWVAHAQDWTSKPVYELAGNEHARQLQLSRWLTSGGYLVANYAQLRLHAAGDLWRATGVIVDEAHNIRNRETEAFKHLRRVVGTAKYLYILTATPVVNLTGDLWALLSMVDPKRFGSYWSFVFRFCDVEDDGYGLKVGGVRPEEQEPLRRLLSAYVLQRSKAAVLTGLPERIRETHDYGMPKEQATLYRRMLDDMKVALGDCSVSADVVVAQVTRLRQLAIHPGLLLPGYTGSSKLDLLPELVLDERFSKTVVFTAFAEAAVLAAEFLNQKNIPTAVLRGGMTDAQRADVLQQFQHGGTKVLIVTHRTGGEGLNLVQASQAIFLDLAWHPAGNRHAEDRVYRIGQKAQLVRTVVLRTKGSIEEHVEQIIRTKGAVTIEELLKEVEDGAAVDDIPIADGCNGVQAGVVFAV